MSSAKKIFLLPGLLLLASFLSAQVSLDSIPLKTLKGPMISYSELTRKTPVVLVCFWSVNSDRSVDELNAINKQYERWKKLAAFKLLAVCVDQGNILNRMRPMAIMNDWTFDVCGDPNGDLQKALQVNNLPQSVILKKDQILYQQSGFEAGTEDYLFAKVQALAGGK